jgi:hypothetical protein
VPGMACTPRVPHTRRNLRQGVAKTASAPVTAWRGLVLQQDRKITALGDLAGLRTRRVDSIAEALELPNHSRGVLLLGLSSDDRGSSSRGQAPTQEERHDRSVRL